MKINKTLSYYNENADTFVQGTVHVDMWKNQQKFSGRLKKALIYWIWAAVRDGTQSIFYSRDTVWMRWMVLRSCAG